MSYQYLLKLQYVVHAHAWDEVVLRGRPGDGPFMAFYLAGGRLHAALAVNLPRDLGTLNRLIAANVEPDPAALADEDVPLKALVPSPA